MEEPHRGIFNLGRRQKGTTTQKYSAGWGSCSGVNIRGGEKKLRFERSSEKGVGNLCKVLGGALSPPER